MAEMNGKWLREGQGLVGLVRLVRLVGLVELRG